MTIFLIILLSVSVIMILFGHFILSLIDKYYVYPKRLAELQTPIPTEELRTAPPEDLPPAIVSMLWEISSTRNPSKLRRSTRVTVTLLDLIHRGKIGVMRDGKKLYLIPAKIDTADLLPYERTLWCFIEEAYRSNDRLSVAKLKGYIEEHRDRAANMRVRFMDELNQSFESYGYAKVLKRRVNQHPLALFGAIAVLASLGALLGWLCQNIPLGVISIGFAGFAAWLSVQVFTYDLTYLTDKGVSAISQWQAYHRYLQTLKNTSAVTPSVDQWNRIAVYAVSMEESFSFRDLNKIWKNLPEYSLECELYDPYFYKKLSEIDYAILISNAESVDSDLFKYHT